MACAAQTIILSVCAPQTEGAESIIKRIQTVLDACLPQAGFFRQDDRLFGSTMEWSLRLQSIDKSIETFRNSTDSKGELSRYLQTRLRFASQILNQVQNDGFGDF